jgi:hypothetical protein
MKKLFFLLVSAILLLGCSKEEEYKEYEYIVSCTSDTCQVMYLTEYNSIQNVWSMTSNEWHYKFTTQNEDKSLYLYAKNSCNYGNLTITIMRDNAVIDQKTVSGAYCYVELNGRY